MNGQWPEDGLEHVGSCPICGSTSREAAQLGTEDLAFGAAQGRWNLYQCCACCAAYLDPRPNTSSIHLAYSNYYTHADHEHEVAGVLKEIRRAIANSYRSRAFNAQFRPSLPGGWLVLKAFPAQAHMLRLDGRGLSAAGGADRSVLDVGCGNGRFLAFAMQLGWRVFGVEMDPIAAEQARRMGLQILGARIEDLRADTSRRFDVITLNHVLEHVHDPVGLLADCRRLLKPGGFLWVETPNIESAGHELYGRYWRGLEPPRHLVIFGHRSLERCLDMAGFGRIQVLPPRDVAWYTLSLSAAMAEGQIVEIQRSPLSRSGERLLKKNIALARKLLRKDSRRSEFISAIAFQEAS